MNRRSGVLLVVLVALVGVSGSYGASDVRHADGGPTVAVADVDDGRLVHYDFDRGYRPVVPNRASSRNDRAISRNDRATARFDGRLRGDPRNVSYLPRNDGLSLHFDGGSGSIAVSNASSLPVHDEATFAFWIRLDRAQAADVLGDDGSYRVLIDGTELRFVATNGDDRLAAPSAEIPVGEWVHVVATYDADLGARLFVDGDVADEEVATGGNSTVSPPDELVLGADGRQDGFRGAIDDFSVWNRSLSAAEVRALHRGNETTIRASPEFQIAASLFALLAVLGVTVLAESR